MIYYNLDSQNSYERMHQNNQQIVPNNHNNNRSNENGQTQTSPYFQLMEAVGTHNRYQFISMIVWCILWLTTGTILLGTPFLMLNPPYICPNSQLSSQNCQQWVCALPPADRLKYLDPNAVSSIANSFSDLHCDKAWISDLLASLVYMGCFFGYISISILVDNMGRKRGLLVAYGIATAGMLVAVFSGNIYLAGVGLFMMGYGSDSAINICFYFITETMSSKYRQKYSILIQVFFSLGGVVNVGYFYVVKNWRTILWIFLISPSVLCLLTVIFIIKDTPYFLIKLRSRQIIVEQLKSIYKINFKSEMTSQKEEQLRSLVVQLKDFQNKTARNSNQQKQMDSHRSNNINGQQSQQVDKEKLKHKIYTPLDLFRYKSIRFISIAVCSLSTFIYILYYGPLMLIDKLSFNLYVNALVVTLSQLVTYPISYFYIHKIPRRKIGIVLYAICGGSAFVLIFVIGWLCDQTERTRGCHLLKVLEMLLIFAFRFCSSLQFAIFLLYSNEVFPTQIRGTGIGISSALGTVASTSSPFIFGSYLSTNSQTSKIMIVFVVISLIGVFFWWKLPQTLNQPIKDQIQQIQAKEVMFENKEQGENAGHIQLVQIKEGD